MAEVITTRNVLELFGCVLHDGTIDAGTIHWITITMGINGAAVFNSLSKTVIDSLYKRLGRDSTDQNIPIAERPNDNVRVMKAMNNVVIGVRYYASRGMALNNDLMMKLNHAKAVQFFDMAAIHRIIDHI